MQRVLQRGILPNAIQGRNIDFIKDTDTVIDSATLASGEDVVFTMTTQSSKDVRIWTQENISLFEGSISEDNLIPAGANVTASDYQIIGPIRDQSSGDGNNIVSKIYIRNTSSTPSTDFSKRVVASNDDADQSSSGLFLSDATISTGNGGAISGDITLGVRFTNITIPQGETINSATLTFTANSTDTNNVLTKIYGIDEDNANDFNTTAPTSQVKTTANVDWDLNGVTANNTYVTSDLSSAIQEIIDRAGWSSGNAMGFIIEDDGSTEGSNHSFKSYDGSSSAAALLDINYGGGAGESKTVIFRGRTRYISPRDDVTIS